MRVCLGWGRIFAWARGAGGSDGWAGRGGGAGGKHTNCGVRSSRGPLSADSFARRCLASFSNPPRRHPNPRPRCQISSQYGARALVNLAMVVDGAIRKGWVGARSFSPYLALLPRLPLCARALTFLSLFSHFQALKAAGVDEVVLAINYQPKVGRLEGVWEDFGGAWCSIRAINLGVVHAPREKEASRQQRGRPPHARPSLNLVHSLSRSLLPRS